MNGFRYIILLISTLSMTFIYSNRIVFGFTVICQVSENNTDNGYFLADSSVKAWMFTMTAIGMCFGPIPLYWAYALNTRDFQFHGFAQAAQLHFTNEVVLTWAMQTEASLFFSILLAASQIGPLFTMVLGGEMCSSPLGWEATYYTLGFLTLVTTLTYSLVYSDNVEKNR
uniref:Transporter n=1 Tax=Angiostrongylus cantonensis TaxID=6313 RepID=A0A0K0DPC7_ANGCA